MHKEPVVKDQTDVECPLCKPYEEKCPRCQAYERLPKSRALQGLITFVESVPHVGQTPILIHNEVTRLITIFVGFYLSIAAAWSMIVMFAAAGPIERVMLGFGIAASVLVTSGMARSLSNYIVHYASHGAFGKHGRRIGELASMTSMSLSFDEYSRTHGEHHPFLTSEMDPDQQTIAALKFTPGMPFGYYKINLLRVALSPRYFFLHLRGRIDSQFASELSRERKLAVVVVQSAPLAIAITGYLVFGSPEHLVAWTISWLLPLTYGAYLSTIIFALGLHRWFLTREPGMSAREFYRAKTGGRFLGDPLPHEDLPLAKRYLAWVCWWLRFLVLHLLIGRMFILGVTDNSSHDAHHVDPHGNKYKWCNSVYSRQRLVTSGPDARKLWHTWGSIFTPIMLNFERMSQMPKPDQDVTAETPETNFLRTQM